MKKMHETETFLEHLKRSSRLNIHSQQDTVELRIFLKRLEPDEMIFDSLIYLSIFSLGKFALTVTKLVKKNKTH